MNKAKKKFIAIVSGVAAFLLVLTTVASSVMYSMKNDMDALLGKGEAVKVSSAGLDGNYYNFKFDNKADAVKYAQQLTQKTAEEGTVLLKNEGNVLPLKGDALKVTLLGYYGWHNNMSGGEDPATTAGAISLYKGLEDDKNILVNPNINDGTLGQLVEKQNECSGQITTSTEYTDFGSEYVAQALDQYKDSYAEYSTAIITLKRNSGEGNDQVTNVASSAVASPSGEAYQENEFNRTGLTLTLREMALIDYASKNFKTVIILVNAANTMELGFLQASDPNVKQEGGRLVYTDPYGSGHTMDITNIKAALWVGCCGSQGGTALANILNGTVNPSGHLSDIYARTLRNDPTYVNFGSFSYTNSAELGSYADTTWFLEYEENIYIGYRYHETAAKEAQKGNYASYDYDREVVYPFGYGLSYTTFSREFEGTPTYDSATESYTFKVKVTNTGSVAGKGVAQIYVNVPYEAGQVEKSHVVLGGFAKTAELAPGASETVTIVISRDYFESYDYQKEKAYILDAGNYNFYLANDEEGSHSWESIDQLPASERSKVLWTTNITKKVVYNEANGKRASDLVLATNAMDEELNWKFKDWTSSSVAGDGYIHNFTRSNFAGSFPTAPTGDDLIVLNEYAKKYLAKYDPKTDTENVVDEDGNKITEMPATNTDETSYKLSDMRGVSLDDPKWVDYIKQFTVESMALMFGNGGWGQPGDTENGVPATFDTDSPYGYYDHNGVASENNRWYCGGPMVAATFNVELAKELGDAFGEEANQMNAEGVARINGVYGYGMNQHRSAFGGRNYEYYSEDPVLCGKMGAAEAAGAAEKGLVVYMKHFVLNDQESHRQDNGYCSYVNEQAFREVYTRAWEIYVKEAKCDIQYYDVVDGEYVLSTKTISAANGMMTSYNRVGATYAGASYCINRMLRNEWGFTGTVLTDAGGEPDTYMTSDLALRRGQQLCLTNNGGVDDSLVDTTSAVAVTWLQKSTAYLLYNIANSNAMQDLAPGDTVYYKMSPWQIGLNIAWAVVGTLAVAAVVLDVLVAKDIIKLKEKAKKAEEEF